MKQCAAVATFVALMMGFGAFAEWAATSAITSFVAMAFIIGVVVATVAMVVEK
jgi:hypothetical protein